MAFTSLSVKIPKSMISISLITITEQRYVVQIATKDLPRYDTQDVDTFYISAASLKAVLWSSWQRTWGSRPPDQNGIKLVHFGQTINDFMLLRCSLKPHRPTVVQIAIESLTKPDLAKFYEVV
ncbi:hypothetical protein BKA64DRAFT_96243 [Cadophora sp. MPI-SDFR-AT-0126]|nr:hypothetical protein BKA64DRAFT_96243 [Leotiomycetes sp. MPI-SDFR-AT-0126]